MEKKDNKKNIRKTAKVVKKPVVIEIDLNSKPIKKKIEEITKEVNFKLEFLKKQHSEEILELVEKFEQKIKEVEQDKKLAEDTANQLEQILIKKEATEQVILENDEINPRYVVAQKFKDGRIVLAQGGAVFNKIHGERAAEQYKGISVKLNI